MLVQKLRIQRGWSQEQLAELSGLSVRTIQRIERGQPASAETLKSLASVFEIDFSALMPAEAPAPAPEPTMAADSFDPLPGGTAAAPATPRISAEERLAMRQVRRLRAFYGHLATYVVVILMLLAINLLTRPQHLWVVWPALGWGVAVVLQGIKLWGDSRFLGADWERREIEKRLGRPL
ncbi:MAG: helix-turn-helix domain-containing protein [Rubrivivax sp.]